MEKVLFVEISSLDNERGCFASNKYFSEFFGISERQIRTYVGTLKEKGFVSVTIKNRNERVIRVVGKYARVRGEDLQKLKNTRHELIHKMTMTSMRG
ncbi:MAG: helix-turn-helix domain-containing protein [Verrucomicrobiae bacterium]|nr:helix-turn-helix domain-containing protein [Verrucomicrobiae bacterium]